MLCEGQNSANNVQVLLLSCYLTISSNNSSSTTVLLDLGLFSNLMSPFLKCLNHFYTKHLLTASSPYTSLISFVSALSTWSFFQLMALSDLNYSFFTTYYQRCKIKNKLLYIIYEKQRMNNPTMIEWQFVLINDMIWRYKFSKIISENNLTQPTTCTWGILSLF